jgi:hypothetical protein
MSRETLVELLENLSAGPIANNLRGQVITLLQDCWWPAPGLDDTRLS